MNPKIRPALLSIALTLGAACTSSSQFGIVLQPETTAHLQVLGDNPFVQVDNDGPGPIDVTFAPGVGDPEQVRVLRGTSARTLRGGGILQLTLVDGERANVQVEVQGSTGTDLRVHGAAR